MIPARKGHSFTGGRGGRVLFGLHWRVSRLGYLPADSRPLKVISKAFSAAFVRREALLFEWG
jgi:hypothetical protein